MTMSETRKFATGAERSKDADATRYDLITPIGLKAVAEAYAEGAAKYADFNWEKGMPANDMLNHAIRHIFEFLAGDRSEPHLGHAAWNVLAAIHSVEMWPHLNEGTLRGPGCTRPEARQEKAVPLGMWASHDLAGIAPSLTTATRLSDLITIDAGEA